MKECKSEKEKYCCKTRIGEFTIQSDATTEKGGQGKGIRPHDILAAAYASCLNMSVRMACDKKQIPYDLIIAKVELIHEDKRTIFTYQIDFNNQISEILKIDILKLVENCPVRKTLSKTIEFQLLE
jgi:putative redox protein